MSRGAWVWVLVSTTACGGATPAAEEPDPIQEEVAADPAPESEPATDETTDATAESEAATTTTLTDDDLRDVIEQVLQDPGLDQYLHLNVRGRLPLAISGPGLPAKLEVIKGGYHVKVVEGPKNEKDPVLVFTKIERDGTAVRLRYRYDVEGIDGSAVVFHKDGAWTLGSNRVIEK